MEIDDNSVDEDWYVTIGDLSAGIVNLKNNSETMIGRIDKNDILFVVYTERIKKIENGIEIDVTRLISARFATNFERGIYYGKY